MTFVQNFMIVTMTVVAIVTQQCQAFASGTFTLIILNQNIGMVALSGNKTNRYGELWNERRKYTMAFYTYTTTKIEVRISDSEIEKVFRYCRKNKRFYLFIELWD